LWLSIAEQVLGEAREKGPGAVGKSKRDGEGEGRISDQNTFCGRGMDIFFGKTQFLPIMALMVY